MCSISSSRLISADHNIIWLFWASVMFLCKMYGVGEMFQRFALYQGCLTVSLIYRHKRVFVLEAFVDGMTVIQVPRYINMYQQVHVIEMPLCSFGIAKQKNYVIRI